MEDNYNNERPEVVTGGPPNGGTQSNALGVVSLVLGIIGVVVFCCNPLPIILGVIAVICGFIAKSKGQKFAMAGIILGFIAIGLNIIILILLQVGGGMVEEFFNNFDFEQWLEGLEGLE